MNNLKTDRFKLQIFSNLLLLFARQFYFAEKDLQAERRD